MIKRALGFLDPDGAFGAGGADSDSENEGLTEVQRRRLERRLLPGAIHASTSRSDKAKGKKRLLTSEKDGTKPKKASKAKKGKKSAAAEEVVKELIEQQDEDVSDEDDADDDDDDDDAAPAAAAARRWLGYKEKEEIKWGIDSEDSEEEDDDSDLEGEGAEEETDDENPQMYEVQKEVDRSARVNRGRYKCQLCPDKILLSDEAMDEHIKSKAHQKAVQTFERAKEIGVEAYMQECEERRIQREKLQAGVSKKQKRNALHTAKTRALAHERQAKKPATTSKASKAAEKLSEASIEAKKQKFQDKKARRLARKAEQKSSS